MNTNRDLEIMKLAVDSEVRRAAAENDMYDQQRAINSAIAMGVTRKWVVEPTPYMKAQQDRTGYYPAGIGDIDEDKDTEHLLELELRAQEALGYDV